MKGIELFKYCINKKYALDEFREYVQTLMTLSSQMEEEDFFPLLEKAEKENKRLYIIEDDSMEIKDQYNIEDVIIV